MRVNQNVFIMKKLLLLLVLIMSIFVTAQAGYVIKGISTISLPDDLKNFTIALNEEGVPISAASMYTSLGGGTGRNSIVIIPADITDPATYFPALFPFGIDENYNIDVRDFHYIPNRDVYVLCGSRKANFYSRAFVAVIRGDLSSMMYNEYAEADMFYSIWAENSNPPSLDYFVCGTRGAYGVIASVATSNLLMTNFYITENVWQYHKIIAKQGGSYRLVASGRNPACDQIGFTIFVSSFTSIYSYYWAQNSEPASHCVVCDYAPASDKVVLASSYQSSVTLNLVTFTFTPAITISTYHYYAPYGTQNSKYNVQDIGMFDPNDAISPRISVVGFVEDGVPLRTMAWHGYVLGLSPTAAMNNNFYFGSVSEEYMHYKIKGNPLGNEFTGGYHQSTWEKSALFGTPLTIADNCDHRYSSAPPVTDNPVWTTFNLVPKDFSHRVYNTFLKQPYLMDYDGCDPFRGSALAPELVMPVEQESEITTFYDHITVKDTPVNTNYQIFSIQGQLIQTISLRVPQRG
jgi:hypothetical protein